MKNYGLLILELLLISLALNACGKPTAPEPAPPTPAESVETINWTFAAGAIRVGLIADPVLNVAGLGTGPSSTGLTLCLYQLEDPNQFLTLAKAKPGLLKLLECSLEIKGVISSDRLYVQPGQKSDLRFDRLEKTRYLGAVAGYFDLRPTSAAAVLPLPIDESREYFLFKRYSPKEFEAWLRLKAQNLAFFPKTEKDYGRLAKDVELEPQAGETNKPPRPKNGPTIATPGEKELKQAAKAARASPPPKVDGDENPIVRLTK
ncbi:MAG: type VI secretion lipoprotein TssJ [Deltaproteobacteria bacterium]|nr:type VI secretion lipoprotein TssJ [Deltaproteobacteria bacterium]